MEDIWIHLLILYVNFADIKGEMSKPAGDLLIDLTGMSDAVSAEVCPPNSEVFYSFSNNEAKKFGRVGCIV